MCRYAHLQFKHRSRQDHALRRVRGPQGRFLGSGNKQSDSAPESPKLSPNMSVKSPINKNNSVINKHHQLVAMQRAAQQQSYMVAAPATAPYATAYAAQPFSAPPCAVSASQCSAAPRSAAPQARIRGPSPLTQSSFPLQQIPTLPLAGDADRNSLIATVQQMALVIRQQQQALLQQQQQQQ